METKVEELFSSLGVRFEVDFQQHPVSEIRCLGKISYLPKTIEGLGAKIGQLFWESSSNWVGFDKADLESWLVDAPLGDHIILIENELNLDFSFESPSGITVELWGRNKLALIIGFAVLDGVLDKDINPNKKEIEKRDDTLLNNLSDEEESLFSKINVDGLICINSKVDPVAILETLGLSQVPCQPILLELNFWLVNGNLNGPENLVESRKWVVLEDEFRNKMTLEENLSFISTIPTLPILHFDKKISDEKLRRNLNKLCDERRHESISTSDLNSGKLLRWWRLDINSIEWSHKSVLIPSWVFKSHLDGKKIIHGLSGDVLEFNGELKGID